MNTPIPKINIAPKSIATQPDIKNSSFIIVNDNDYIVVDMQYFKNKIPEATPICYLREEVYNMLLTAAKKLPKGYKLKVYDAWRPLNVQKYLYNFYRDNIIKSFSHLPPSEIEKIVSGFVSVPSENKLTPPVHTTGGAVDVTIVDKNGDELDMGTVFDAFEESANTYFFEESKYEQIKTNRRLLYNTMISVGFTNLPSEWWHYDYGDAFWALLTTDIPKYPGIFIENEIPRPLSI